MTLRVSAINEARSPEKCAFTLVPQPLRRVSRLRWRMVGLGVCATFKSLLLYTIRRCDHKVFCSTPGLLALLCVLFSYFLASKRGISLYLRFGDGLGPFFLCPGIHPPKLTYLSVYDSRDGASEFSPSPSPPSSLMHVHIIQSHPLPTSTLLTCHSGPLVCCVCDQTSYLQDDHDTQY
jgi:hypothetical protein